MAITQKIVDTYNGSQPFSVLEAARPTGNGQNYRAPGFIGNFDRSIIDQGQVDPSEPDAATESGLGTIGSYGDGGGGFGTGPATSGIGSIGDFSAPTAHQVGSMLGTVAGMGLGAPFGSQIGSSLADLGTMNTSSFDNSPDLGTQAAVVANDFLGSTVSNAIGIGAADAQGATAQANGFASSPDSSGWGSGKGDVGATSANVGDPSQFGTASDSGSASGQGVGQGTGSEGSDGPSGNAADGYGATGFGGDGGGGDAGGGGGGGGGGGWVICTELMRQGRIPRQHWAAGMRRFDQYHLIFKLGYWAWAIPSVRHLKERPNSRYSRFMEKAFAWRAQNIAAVAGVPGARRCWQGYLVESIGLAICGAIGAVVMAKNLQELPAHD